MLILAVAALYTKSSKDPAKDKFPLKFPEIQFPFSKDKKSVNKSGQILLSLNTKLTILNLHIWSFT